MKKITKLCIFTIISCIFSFANVLATTNAGSDSNIVMYKYGMRCRYQRISVTGVSLNKTNITMNIGDTETLTATVAPSNATNKAVTWSSNDPSVATVDENGTVTAVESGSTYITVTTVDCSKTATCEVTVTGENNGDVIDPSGVILEESTVSLNVGETQTLTATVVPPDATNKAVTWSSSDSSIAAVDEDGTVTGIGPGNADIVVTTVVGAKTATCEVTITSDNNNNNNNNNDSGGDDVNAPPDIVLEESTINLNVDETQILTLADTTNKDVTSSSSDTSVTTVDENSTVTGIEPGNADVMATPVVDAETSSSSDTSVATVDENSTVTGIEPGNADVVATPAVDAETSTGEVTVVDQVSTSALELVNTLNSTRTNEGLSKLNLDTNLVNIANVRAKYLADNNYSSNMLTCNNAFQLMNNCGISYSHGTEVLALGHETFEAAMSDLMKLQNNKENILNSEFTSVGVGVATGNSGLTYWVLELITNK